MSPLKEVFRHISEYVVEGTRITPYEMAEAALTKSPDGVFRRSVKVVAGAGFEPATFRL
jgi:hypothetical protein